MESVLHSHSWEGMTGSQKKVDPEDREGERTVMVKVGVDGRKSCERKVFKSQEARRGGANAGSGIVRGEPAAYQERERGKRR